MSEHPHAGRIAAAAHLSAALALVECAWETLAEDGIYSPAEQSSIGTELQRVADEIMEPCEIANVLQTVDEVLATGKVAGRLEILRVLVDARQAAKDDETRSCCDSLRAGPHAPDCEIYNAETEDREPTDDELANRHGVEGGIGYRTEPTMEELLREKGDDL